VPDNPAGEARAQCRTPTLQQLWLSVSVAANEYIQARLRVENEAVAIKSAERNFLNARTELAKALKTCLTFDEWAVMRLEE
jgi:hypothetical protein